MRLTYAAVAVEHLPVPRMRVWVSAPSGRGIQRQLPALGPASASALAKAPIMADSR